MNGSFVRRISGGNCRSCDAIDRNPLVCITQGHCNDASGTNARLFFTAHDRIWMTKRGREWGADQLHGEAGLCISGNRSNPQRDCFSPDWLYFSRIEKRKKMQRLNIPGHESFSSGRIRIIIIPAFCRWKLNMK